ncbi:hypothetical protein EC973_001152 [Apophysomyces ossiformis]|uniref:Pseudouridine synthase I TruA alpha/beta domain-containing protein n=1 Tax=Apophysomyces ossiformis TaxID=679940 RepID=A0A8H7EPI6_9FUNG|nr:hypothetical protein EC973_001152 [Apophysomyces ossiformis]
MSRLVRSFLPRVAHYFKMEANTPTGYETWSREQLLERIQALEKQITPRPSTSTQKTNKKKERPFDMSRYEQRRVAFKVAYLGWNYSGFAAQGDDTLPTVEGEIFKALQTCKLIESPDKCNFTRCGRTDKGVSGLGQVISLDVRSNLSKEEIAAQKREDELGYIDTLNRLLPDDIRVFAWAPVAPNFSARFDCKSRTYKYFFVKGQLDLDRMRTAASYLLGEHDFRNFCRLDPSKNITNYCRTIVSLDIRPCTVDTSVLGPGMDFYEVELKGTAFLWHQVRCIMSILFLVGQGLEAPEVIKDLTDITKVPSKPEYTMASDLPLLLYDCEFDNLEWTYASKKSYISPWRTFNHLHEQWCAQMIRGLMYQTFLDAVKAFSWEDEHGQQTLHERRVGGLDRSSREATIVLGGGKEIRTSRYKKLMERPRGDTDEMKKEKYNARKKRKLEHN